MEYNLHNVNSYVFDTMGTTIPESAVRELNEEFFRYATELGYTQTKVDELRELRKQNPKDARFLKESGPGKVRLLEEGLVKVELYPDVKKAFDMIPGKIKIFSKGALDLVAAIYESNGLIGVVGKENIVSSTDFVVSDKTNPDCYMEFSKLTGARMLSYNTDDAEEANACQESSQSHRVFYINRRQKQSAPLKQGIILLDNLVEATLMAMHEKPWQTG